MYGALVLIVTTCFAGADPDAELADVLDAAEGAVRDESGLDVRPGTLPPKDPRAGGDPRILKVGDREWHIAPALRDFYSQDVSTLQELARPTPHRGADGAIDGWEMHLDRYGLAHQAGFRNGDVVRSINGRVLSSWPAVLAAYRELRKEERLVVTVTRRDGRELRLVYDIR